MSALGVSIYTTGHVARLCGVAPRTAAKWIDSGQLRGRRIPGSQDRRVMRADLLEFLVANGMPTDGVEDLRRVLVVADGPTAVRVVAALGEAFECRTEDGGFAAGVAAVEWRPTCLVIDVERYGRIEAAQIAAGVALICPGSVRVALSPGGPDPGARTGLWDATLAPGEWGRVAGYAARRPRMARGKAVATGVA